MANFELVSEFLPVIIRYLPLYEWFKYVPTNMNPIGLGEPKTIRRSTSNKFSKESTKDLISHLDPKPEDIKSLDLFHLLCPYFVHYFHVQFLCSYLTHLNFQLPLKVQVLNTIGIFKYQHK